MKIELTTKDIRLLKIMFTLLITVLMVRFLILPALEDNQTLRYEQEEAELKQEEMQYSIDGRENSRAIVEKTRQELQAVSASYYPLMEQREIDELVTGLAYRHELFPSRLDMGQRFDGILGPYLYSKSGAQEEAEGDDTAGQQEEGKGVQRYMQSMEASITLVGKEQNFLSLLDDIEKNYPSVQVRAFDVTRNAYMNTSLNLVEETQGRLVLTVYMCDKQQENKQER